MAADGQFAGIEVANVSVRRGADPVAIAEARDQLAAWLVPCDVVAATTKLLELRTLTVHRARDDVDVELMATAYSERIARYPADVVTAACNAWADREEFWPSWAELKFECDKRMHGRLSLKAALDRAASAASVGS